MRQIIRGANACDFGRDVEHGRSQFAGDQIGFVALGDREYQVGIAGAGTFEGFRVTGIADDGAQVQAILQLAQPIGVDIDDGDVVCFRNQVFGDGAADLPGTENDNTQTESPCRSTGGCFGKKRNCIPRVWHDPVAGCGLATAWCGII